MSTLHKHDTTERHIRGCYRTTIQKPNSILDYSLSMGAVDKMDQLLQPYSGTRKSDRTHGHRACRTLIRVFYTPPKHCHTPPARRNYMPTPAAAADQAAGQLSRGRNITTRPDVNTRLPPTCERAVSKSSITHTQRSARRSFATTVNNLATLMGEQIRNHNTNDLHTPSRTGTRTG